MIREAVQMALEALEDANDVARMEFSDEDYYSEAINALRQALKTEQGPVAWASSLDFDDDDQEIIPAKDKGKLGTSNCDIPLYTALPKHNYVIDCPRCGHCCQALEEKQEPFEYWSVVEGWVKIDEVREHFDAVGCGTIYKSAGEGRVPLYTTPPKREWVGLTAYEIQEIHSGNQNWGNFACAIEAKLKEKNT